ncbi:glycosyltransferase [Herbiconiux moechotypicola]|uniref:Glycosyltransferase 2-like domain-containing protein n=1 Tax=Herbiconiux moechotypicola TaxID=637393 RepID=A0ABN3DV53_9MICO|nr:glycosyltransferase [Herbiconiux moechotypicola]MCS5730992.1 glycosyltransferase [Herbiconiux moechotypicola]
MSRVADEPPPRVISVVIPVYRGESTLASTVGELLPHTRVSRTAQGATYRVGEIILVHDAGPDRSDLVLQGLERRHEVVRVVWLSRNVGQHAATIAGMAASQGDWIATLDEDGQHDPGALGDFLDTALRERAGVVYARFADTRAQGALRSAASVASKRMLGAAFKTPGI